MTPKIIKFRIKPRVKIDKQVREKFTSRIITDHNQHASRGAHSPRSKDGCFCCRKRRIKCIKSSPSCKNCLKSGYLCVWPQGNESLSHNTDFQLVRVDTELTGHKGLPIMHYLKHPCPRTPTETAMGKGELSSSTLYSLTDCEYGDVEELVEDVGSVAVNIHRTTYAKNVQLTLEKCEVLFRGVMLGTNSSATGLLSYPFSAFPNYNAGDRLLFEAFLNGFIVNISPQLTHIKLQPGSVFILTGVENMIVQTMFLSCGAAFLSSKKDGDKHVIATCSNKLHESADLLSIFLTKNNVEGNEMWLVAYLLLMYLKSRFVFENHQRTTLNMIAITEVVKVWLAKKVKPLELSLQASYNNGAGRGLDSTNSMLDTNNPVSFMSLDCCEPIKTPEKMLLRVINDSRALVRGRYTLPVSQTYEPLYLDSESFQTDLLIALLGTGESIDNHCDTILPQERTMIESFAYNYSITLFMCDKSLTSQITSPFVIFDCLRPYLLKPVYNCAVPWMNHPVVGAALPLFELQAKVSWISLFTPLSLHHRKILTRIIKISKYYIRPILPVGVYCREPESFRKKLMESCYAAEILAKTVYIYATKLLYPETKATDKHIQDALQYICVLFSNITVQSQVHLILCFSFSIMASCAVKQEHREFLKWKLGKLIETFSLQTFQSVQNFCDVVWNESAVLGVEGGLDMLFDPEYIKILNP